MRRNIVKVILMILIFNLILAGGWWFFYSQIQKTRRALFLLTADIAAAELKQKNIRALTRLLQDIEQDRKKIENAFVDERSVVEFIKEVERVGDLSGARLTIESVSLLSGPREGGPIFRFTATGRFGSLFTFLHLLENINYQIAFEETRFLRSQNRWTGTFRVRLLSFMFNM
ncbi:hypothetical protein IIA95_00645 [Patescibacteria group bacterium]|nr:hypothetical protein [Patescibacteria group bacterium]